MVISYVYEEKSIEHSEYINLLELKKASDFNTMKKSL